MCMTPFCVQLKDKGYSIPVPCGKCPECCARRTAGWSFRLMQEDKISSCSHFITLTYDTDHVPITSKKFLTVTKRDPQLFFKRLRKLNSNKLKYYLAAEYGSKTWRPHYHVILFNCDIATIQPAWNLGSVYYGEVTGASVGYTLKYISKPKQIPRHQNDDRTPEFSLMSKGLGANYITDQMVRWHHADLYGRMYLNLDGGKKCAMPRYYKDKIYSEFDRQEVGYRAQQAAIDKFNQAIAEGGPTYFRDLAEATKAAFLRMHTKALSNSKI